MEYILPWHKKVWSSLITQRDLGKLPHAILLTGMSGVGKSRLAKNLASLLLCQNGSSRTDPCDRCQSCSLLQTGNHPDLLLVEPEESGKAIKIDQIRDVVADLSTTSHQGGSRVVIIEQAEMLNTAAANALLKTLEEPQDSGTIIILISAAQMLLPATIRSRCQAITIKQPKYNESLEWLRPQVTNVDIDLLLALTENAPLKALNLLQGDILSLRRKFFDDLDKLRHGKIALKEIVSNCLEWDLENLLITMIMLVNDLVKLKSFAGENIANLDQREKMVDLSHKLRLEKIFAYHNHLSKLRGYVINKINLNHQLLIENLLINWSLMF